MIKTTNKDERANSLLQAYRQGNDEAFTLLYDMFIPMLLNYGHCLTTDNELVKDCAHDVFVKLLDKGNPPQINRVSSYLIISLRNRLVDEFRRNNNMTDLAVEDLLHERATTDVEYDYVVCETNERKKMKVDYLLDNLTPRQRQAFQLYYMEERKYEEICELMHMNYHSIRNLVHRGMLKLRAVAV